MEEVNALKKTVANREPDIALGIKNRHNLTICLVEECSELLEAIDNLDFELMREELGDLLLQVVMHARLAEEKAFKFEDVARILMSSLSVVILTFWRGHPFGKLGRSSCGVGENKSF